MEDTFQIFLDLWDDIREFFFELASFIIKSLHISFLSFEARKGVVVTALYRQRGKLSRRLTHGGMAALTAMGVMLAPIIAQQFPGKSVDPWQISAAPQVLSASTEDPGIDTQISQNIKYAITDYTVQPGDTVASIAQKFGISVIPFVFK